MIESLTNFRARCLQAALDLLWRQWCSIGVSGHARPANPSRVIDLETLVLATTRLGVHDVRLFDESVDWLRRFDSLIHLQRLRTLQSVTELGDSRVLPSMAAWLAEEGGRLKWKAYARTMPSFESTVVALRARDMKGDLEPVFARHGVFRPPLQLRGMSRAPNPTLGPNILLSLRALIGVSARAEVILCLATGKASTPSEIARLTGYTPRTMQLLLQEMSLSGQVLYQEASTTKIKTPGRGVSRRYQMTEDEWRFIIGGKPLPQWTAWAPLWALVCTIVETIPGEGEPEKHPAVISSKIRDTLLSQGDALATAGFLPFLDIRSGAPGDELLVTLEKTLPGLLESL